MGIQELINPFTWDWASIVHAAVGTAAMQGAITLYRERTQKQDKAAYLALRVAVMLRIRFRLLSILLRQCECD